MPSLNELRAYEFSCVKGLFNPESRILELGGGTGYQASLIAACGASVESIDVSLPSGESYYPVRLYDGKCIPYPSASFDMVFSSNVLEHISDLRNMLSELRRVMKPGGLAVHILPTPAWRLATSLTHYLHILKRIGEMAGRRLPASQLSTESQDGKQLHSGHWRIVKRIFFDGPHGEYPSAFAELWFFSKRRWIRLFSETGYEVVDTRPTHIFYTGYNVFPWVPVDARRCIAEILGSATRVYILRKLP